MLVYSQDRIKLLSLSVIIFGLLKKQSDETEEKDNVLKLGIITYVLSLVTVLSIKSISYSLWLGIWIFQPLSIFLFLMIIQQIWKIASK